MDFEMGEPLSLTNICGGKLEDQFQELYPAIAAALRQGNKGSIAITLDFKRVENTTTLVDIKYSITPKLPKQARSYIAEITGESKIKTEKVKPKLHNVVLFEKEATDDGK